MANGNLKNILSLIRDDRLRKSTGGKKNILTASESDKGRVVNSAAFRRLQQKAQVFPLETNAAVRTRLTHSIEVSQIGRHIGQKIIEKSSTNNNYQELTAFVNTIETACLLHDIGNPPFGHLGEAAIKEWFSEYGPSELDLTEFDGNPQGFRLTSFLSGHDDYGYNLTCTQLLSTIKYPWDLDSKLIAEQKIGLFSSSYKTYLKCCEMNSWKPGNKFPFVLLMEAADDIAYSMSDLEDGLEKSIIKIDDLKNEFGAEKFNNDKIQPFVFFKTNIINMAVNDVANCFLKNLDTIIEGETIDLIKNDTAIGETLKHVNNYARENIYSHEDAEKVELAGRSIIKGLLSHFKPLLDISETQFNLLINEKNCAKEIRNQHLDFHIRLFHLLPKTHINKYRSKENGTNEQQKRSHLIVDFISGMTDDYALEIYQILQGIRIK